MGLVFGGVALVAVAISALVLLMQRSEHAKLVNRVEERDRKIEEMATRIEVAARTADDAQKDRRTAQETLERFERGAKVAEEGWKQRLGELERERDGLRGELDETQTREDRLAEEAKGSLKASESIALPPRRPEGPCIDQTTIFRQSVSVAMAGALGQQLAAPVAASAESALLARQVPMFPTNFYAYLDIRVHGRSLPAGSASYTSIAIEASLVVPLVRLDLKELEWVPCRTEIDVFTTADSNTIEAMLVARTPQVVEQLLTRAINGGNAGRLATVPMPATPGAPQPGGGVTPPTTPPVTPPAPPRPPKP
jgi:hypothetical protein